jgi:hypothetical protein
MRTRSFRPLQFHMAASAMGMGYRKFAIRREGGKDSLLEIRRLPPRRRRRVVRVAPSRVQGRVVARVEA